MADTPNDVDEQTFNPAAEPDKSAPWLALIDDAQKKLDDWQKWAGRVEKAYASLNKAGQSAAGLMDKEYQIFWANCEVLKPSIYARPPIPVVVPRFKDRRPLYRVASELLERSTVTAFDTADIDSLMRLVRDDLVLNARGTGWVSYEDTDKGRYKGEKVCLYFVDREDFVHDPARDWSCVEWVARRCWMTREAFKKRFPGDAWKDAAFVIGKDKSQPKEGSDPRQRAAVWEIWSKTEDKVIWVTEGVENVLEKGEPHLKLEGFFPCPQPAYGTREPRTLVPVPDAVQYEDQLIEIDKLTNRIHALLDAVQVKGFYPGGGSIGDAIEAALARNDDRKIMIPVDNIAGFGGQGGDPIVWMPIDMIAQTIQQLIMARQQLFADVYQITGISDILRGETDPNETATAQQIKAQSGSVRIRDKQQEMVRFARDLVRITAEIMAEEFDMDTLLAMSQMEIPTDQDIADQIEPMMEQIKQITDTVQRVKTDPQMMQQAQQNPEEAEQQLQQAQQQVQQIMAQVQKLQATPTQEQVQKLLRDDKLRPFVLDIESDSTIQADEQAEKAARTEFVTALSGLIAQFAPVLQTMPQLAPVVGATIKFALAPFRVGRELEGQIDEAIENLTSQAGQPQPNPEAEAMQAQMQMEQQRLQLDMQVKQAELQDKQAEREMKMAEMQQKATQDREMAMLDAGIKRQDHQAKMQQMQAQERRDDRKGMLEVQKLEIEIQKMQLQGALDIAEAQQQSVQNEQQAVQSERAFEQQTALNAQKARTNGD